MKNRTLEEIWGLPYPLSSVTKEEQEASTILYREKLKHLQDSYGNLEEAAKESKITVKQLRQRMGVQAIREIMLKRNNNKE